MSEQRFTVEGVELGYPGMRAIANLTTSVPADKFTVILGPNGCGKSTLLRGLAGLLRPAGGKIRLGDDHLHTIAPKQLAKRVGLMPQSATAPDGITVRELVGRGRFPHQNMWHTMSRADNDAVDVALAQTRTAELAARRVAELSGGQRQRVWAAMLLAQQAPTMLLDEPTTYLDINNQIELLNLFGTLRRGGATVVAVLHDLNQAARYADHLIVMKEGCLMAEGTPHDVLTAELLGRVFDLDCVVIDDPETGTPLIVPRSPVFA